MTEFETMQRAKMYLDKLARGIDPITGREITDDSVLNNVRISRCLFYVSGVLEQVIANGGTVGEKIRKVDFAITTEQLHRFLISSEPIRISEFVELLWKCADNPQMKKPSTTTITNWLLDRQFLRKETGPDGKNRRLPTEAGAAIGLTVRMQQGMHGEYTAVYYTAMAQRFVLDHLQEILGG